MPRYNGGFIGTDGPDAPDPPTGVTASSGDTQLSVSFTAPTDTGTSAITGFVATTNDGIGATGTSSPITITGLTNGTSYTTRVYAINAYGTSAASEASSSASPALQRALFAGGRDNSQNIQRDMDYVNIASTGNATDFGDLLSDGGSQYPAGCGSSTRSIIFGGDNVDDIVYVTIGTLGNAVDFGDLTASTSSFCAALSNSTRAIAAGGYRGGYSDIIEYVTIASTGDAADFGDLSGVRGWIGVTSDSHGGLQA